MLEGLRTQTLPVIQWETIIVDNASSPPLESRDIPRLPANMRIVPEPRLGLTAARRCGLRAARGEICVLVDDDNVLAPTYLADTICRFSDHPKLAAAGGPSRPEFEIPPAGWTREFHPLLALRDLGPAPMLASLQRDLDDSHWLYPEAAPIGAGMALRREPISTWLVGDRTCFGLTDRHGRELTSGGDNDIVLSILRAGWQVGYFPELALTHLIPASRLDPNYLARLNRGIQKSWMQVLALHDANPWPPISRGSVPLRKMKAWLHHRAWESSAAFIRWQGACGHFEGRVASHHTCESPISIAHGSAGPPPRSRSQP